MPKQATTADGPLEQSSTGWQEALAVVACLAGSLWILRAYWLDPANFPAGESWLTGDEGNSLFTIRAILEGKRLYADFYTPYGPLGLISCVPFFLVLGSSASTLVLYHVFWSILLLLILYVGLRRFLSPIRSSALVLFGFLPMTMTPGSMVGGFMNSTYIPVERLLLALVFLSWRLPGERSTRISCALGILCCLLQATKFGGGVIAYFAVLCLDAICAYQPKACSSLAWNHAAIKSHAVTLLCFALSLMSYAGALIAYAGLGPALDQLFPLRLLDMYDAAVTPAIRFPQWFGTNYFLGVQLAPVLGLGLGLVAICRVLVLRRRNQANEPSISRTISFLAPSILAPLFYLTGCLIYFKHVWLYYQYAWVLLFGFLPMVGSSLRYQFPTPILSLLPGFLLLWRTAERGVHPVGTSTHFPNGEMLWGCSNYQTIVDQLRKLKETDPINHPLKTVVMVGRCTSGLHHFLAIPMRLRTPWMAYGMWTKRDDAALHALLEGSTYVVAAVTAPLSQAAIEQGDFFPPVISDSNRRLLASRFIPVHPIGDTVVLLRAKDPTTSSPASLPPREGKPAGRDPQ